MTRRRQLARAADRELRRREAAEQRARAEVAQVQFTLEAIARGSNGELHVPQLRYMESLSRWIRLMCSRRAGKTFGIWGEGISYTGPGGVWWNRQT